MNQNKIQSEEQIKRDNQNEITNNLNNKDTVLDEQIQSVEQVKKQCSVKKQQKQSNQYQSQTISLSNKGQTQQTSLKKDSKKDQEHIFRKQRLIIQQKDQKQNSHKQSPQKQSSSIISSLMTTMKSFTVNQKPKHNPLLIDQDIQQEQQIQNSLKSNNKLDQQNHITQQLNHSVISLPPNLKQQALDMIIHQQNNIQEVFQQIKSQITVQIIQVIQKGGPISKYFIYTLKGQDMHGRFLVKRKYNQFISLRKILFHRWPGSFIPGLKNKIQMKNQQEKQLLINQILINFIINLSYSKHIYYKQEVQLFLRSPDIDFCQMFDQMPQLKTSDLISRFQYAFGQQLQQMQGPKITQQISKFHKKLRKIIPKLQQIANKVLNLAQSYDSYIKNVLKFGQTMKLYEHFSLAQFTQNSRDMTILVKDDQRKIDRMKDILVRNPFYQLFSLFQIQLIDARAFLESIIAIDMYTLRKQQLQKQILLNEGQKQSIDGGNMSIKTMTTRKHKQQLSRVIQDKLRLLYEQKEQVIRMYCLVQKVTGKSIIPVYKGIKKNSYVLGLMRWIQLVNRSNPQLQQIWSYIKKECQQMRKRCKQQ